MSQVFNTRTEWATALICHDYGVPLAKLQAWGEVGHKKAMVVKIRRAIIARLRKLGEVQHHFCDSPHYLARFGKGKIVQANAHSFPKVGATLKQDHSAVLYAGRHN